MDAYVTNNGYLTSVDWSDIGEIPLDIADGDQDTQLTQAQVDAYVANNGYLTSEDVPAFPVLPENLVALDTFLEVEGPEIHFVGANVHIESGSGVTGGPINGLGNLIVGYNENRNLDPYPSDDVEDIRTGSHNIIVGRGHNFSSYGGIVVGSYNTISGPYSTVSGGAYNTATTPGQVVP